MRSNVAHVQCRNTDCSADYDQYVDPYAWEPSNACRHIGGALPKMCGVCGSRNVRVTEAVGPGKVTV